MRPRVVIRTSLLVLLALSWSWPAAAQALGDAARRERERREKLKAEGKSGGSAVIDERTLKANKGVVANDAAPSGTGETGQAPAPPRSPQSADPPPSTGAHALDEELWRGRMRLARANLESMQQQYDMLSKLSLAPNEYYVDRRTGKTWIGSVGRLQQLVAEAKQEVDHAQQAIEALEELARKSRVPPGWLR